MNVKVLMQRLQAQVNAGRGDYQVGVVLEDSEGEVLMLTPAIFSTINSPTVGPMLLMTAFLTEDNDGDAKLA